MKKIILLSIIGLIISGTAYAGNITPGLNGVYGTCKVWRENLGVPYIDENYAKTDTWCEKDEDRTRRIYELEVAVQKLQNKVKTLESNCQVAGSASTSSPLLELRVQTLERTVATLQESINNSLKAILSFLMIKK